MSKQNNTNFKNNHNTTQNGSMVQNEFKPKKQSYQNNIKDIDPNQYITVYNGFQGKLTYTSKRTGENFKWNEFGDEQEMELRELKNARNAHKKYFINNWFMFDEDWIIDYLGVRKYYKNALRLDNFDSVFQVTPLEIKNTISKLSDGQKKSVAYRAKILIKEGKIDSNKSINALEEALGVDLTDKND